MEKGIQRRPNSAMNGQKNLKNQQMCHAIMGRTLTFGEDGIMTHHESKQQICAAFYHVGSTQVKAQLFCESEGIAQRYRILLEHGEERQSCDLGTDLLQARGLFMEIVFGGVTVCTLSDVIEDRMGTLF